MGHPAGLAVLPAAPAPLGALQQEPHQLSRPASVLSLMRALPQGFGWAIAKCLAEAGAEISLGVWVPALNIFETSFRRGAKS